MKELVSGKDASWKEEKYLKPTLADDPILQLGMEIDDGCFMAGEQNGDDDDDNEEMPALESNNAAVIPESWEDMKKTIAKLRSEILMKDREKEQIMEDMARMRATAQSLVEGHVDRSPRGLPVTESTDVSRRDESYAGGYAHFGIHHEMLSDKVRTESYRDAIQHKDSPVSGSK